MRVRLSLTVVLALVVLLAPVGSAHAVPLLATYGGPAGYGVNNLPGNDDGSTAMLDLTAAFPGGLRFFGGPYNTFWVNNNGNITFSGPVYNYTPIPFPIAAQPMIAPYWGDVDTRGGGAPARNGVYWHLAPGLLVVTWHNVGYYSIHDDLVMDFQLILTNALDCGSGNFDVEFRFNTCQWETGDASMGTGGFGGVQAQAGFDAGNMVDFVEIVGSHMAGISTLMCTGSNVGMPGIWRFSVRGGAVACPGTGTPCDTGMPGACGVGVTQCVGRDIVCTGIGTPSAERCDGVDNDCNGSIDDGMDLCASPLICVAGSCVPSCFEGGCATDYTCAASGACVETACIDVMCAAGERCSGGRCIGACEGITCPHGQQCIAGHCANLCSLLTCGTDEVCVDGMCVPTCPCRACAADEICGADGSCTPLGCDVVICDPGFYCSAGACLDACDGAVCPAGQHCEIGECVETPAPDAGIPPPPDAGDVPGVDAGDTPGGDAGALDAGRRTSRPKDAGCGCSVPGDDPSPGWAVALGLLGLVAWRRRRRD